MATMFCALCRRPVEARRRIGVGTVVLGVLTAGLSLLAVPFYSKRCAICNSSAVYDSPPDGSFDDHSSSQARMTALEQRLRLVEDELESAGRDLRRLREERDFYSRLLEAPGSRNPG